MRVSIEFCLMCNYAPKAAETAAALFGVFPGKLASLELLPGKGGAFEVTVNDKKVYSKLETKQFPEFKQLVALIEKEQV